MNTEITNKERHFFSLNTITKRMILIGAVVVAVSVVGIMIAVYYFFCVEAVMNPRESFVEVLIAAIVILLVGIFVICLSAYKLGHKAKRTYNYLDKSEKHARQLIQISEEKLSGEVKNAENVLTPIIKNTAELADYIEDLKHKIEDCGDRQQLMAEHIKNQTAFIEKRIMQFDKQVHAIYEDAEGIGHKEDRMSDNLESHFKGNKKQTDDIKRIVLKMGSLKESLMDIQQYSSVVQSVSKETDFKNLGIGLEAARFGDPGRKLTAMVGEVSNLASRACKAAEEIENIIVAVNAEASAIMDLAGRISKDVDGGRELLVEEAKKLIHSNDIINNIQDNCSTLVKGLDSIEEGTSDMERIASEFTKSAVSYEEYTSLLEPVAEACRSITSELSALLAGIQDLAKS